MATAGGLPKTIFITTLPAAGSNTNYVKCEAGLLPTKIGTKRHFSIISTSPTPVSLTSSSVVTKSPGSLTKAATMNSDDDSIWLPATVERTFKYEPVDDDYDYSGDSEMNGHYGDLGQPPRKRERLTHLNAEEKMFRRKMKNRIAAQTARDRKKALMVDLEDTVRRLEEENDSLLCENTKLREEHSSLAEENDRLKKQLTGQRNRQQVETDGRDKQDDARPALAFGPAESINDPLPKEQAKTGFALTWLVASALIQLYSQCCAKLSPEEEKLRRKLEQMKESDSLTLENVLSQCPPEALEKLWAIVRSAKTIPTQPP